MREKTIRHKDLFLNTNDLQWWLSYLKEENRVGRNPYLVGHESWRQVSDLLMLASEVLNEKNPE